MSFFCCVAAFICIHDELYDFYSSWGERGAEEGGGVDAYIYTYIHSYYTILAMMWKCAPGLG